MAQRKFVASTEMRLTVKRYVMTGTPKSAICELLKINERTLNRHFKTELNTALLEANSAVASNLFRIATLRSEKPSAATVSAGIAWLQANAPGWKQGQAGIFGDEPPRRALIEWDT